MKEENINALTESKAKILAKKDLGLNEAKKNKDETK